MTKICTIMNNVYYKNYGIWLGGALVLLWLLAFSGALDFLAFPVYRLIGWLFLIAGTIAGTVATHKELGKNIEFGKAILAVIVFIGGIGLLQFIIGVARGGADVIEFYLFFFIQDIIIEIVIGISILLAVGSWYMFEKAGKAGWATIVPIYNIIVMCEIAKKPGWWVILLFIPIVNIVFIVMILNGISKNFGKDSGFTVGLVFLGQIFFAVLGYGDAVYLNAQPRTNDAILDS